MKATIVVALIALAASTEAYHPIPAASTEPQLKDTAVDPAPATSLAPEVKPSTVGGQPMSYSFEYRVKDEQTNNDYGHQESSDGKVVTGSYRVLLPDTRTQIVNYTADENGYRAHVKYEGVAVFAPVVPLKAENSQSASSPPAPVAQTHAGQQAPGAKVEYDSLPAPAKVDFSYPASAPAGKGDVPKTPVTNSYDSAPAAKEEPTQPAPATTYYSPAPVANEEPAQPAPANSYYYPAPVANEGPAQSAPVANEEPAQPAPATSYYSPAPAVNEEPVQPAPATSYYSPSPVVNEDLAQPAPAANEAYPQPAPVTSYYYPAPASNEGPSQQATPVANYYSPAPTANSELSQRAPVAKADPPSAPARKTNYPTLVSSAWNDFSLPPFAPPIDSTLAAPVTGARSGGGLNPQARVPKSEFPTDSEIDDPAPGWKPFFPIQRSLNLAPAVSEEKIAPDGKTVPKTKSDYSYSAPEVKVADPAPVVEQPVDEPKPDHPTVAPDAKADDSAPATKSELSAPEVEEESSPAPPFEEESSPTPPFEDTTPAPSDEDPVPAPVGKTDLPNVEVPEPSPGVNY